MSTEVLLPTSREDAIAALGAGGTVAVVGGGTIVIPEITAGRVRPERVILLHRAGLAGIARTGGVVRIGAATPVAELEGGDEPLATAAAYVADPEIRAQATVAGNLCAAPGAETPRGDLQAPLLALGARVRSAGADGETVEELETFLLDGPRGRLVLELEYDDVERRAAHASVHRPHAHHYTILAVSAVRAGAETRVAVAGAAPTALRARAVEEALASGEDTAGAAERVLADVEQTLRDDALASAWYRRRVLPTLVARALSQLDKEDA